MQTEGTEEIIKTTREWVGILAEFWTKSGQN